MIDEVTGRLADVASDHRRLLAESVAFEAHGDDAIVVRPHRAVLIREGIVSRVSLRQRADAPAAPHIRFQESPHNSLGAIRANNAAPKKMTGVRGDRLDRLLVTIKRVRVVANVLTPELFFESFLQL